jgi:hypothetical protein
MRRAIVAVAFDEHNSKPFRSPLGVAGDWPRVNKIIAGECHVCHVCHRANALRAENRICKWGVLPTFKNPCPANVGNLNKKLAHTDWQECKFTLL